VASVGVGPTVLSGGRQAEVCKTPSQRWCGGITRGATKGASARRTLGGEVGD